MANTNIDAAVKHLVTHIVQKDIPINAAIKNQEAPVNPPNIIKPTNETIKEEKTKKSGCC